MAVSEVNYFSGGDEDFYVQTATSNAQVKAWDGASFSDGVVTISLPFTPKYIMTYCQFSNGSRYYNIYDDTFSASKFVRYTVANGSITTNSILTNLPNTGSAAASWLSVVGTNQVQLLLFDTSTLTKALFMASA